MLTTFRSRHNIKHFVDNFFMINSNWDDYPSRHKNCFVFLLYCWLRIQFYFHLMIVCSTYFSVSIHLFNRIPINSREYSLLRVLTVKSESSANGDMYMLGQYMVMSLHRGAPPWTSCSFEIAFKPVLCEPSFWVLSVRNDWNTMRELFRISHTGLVYLKELRDSLLWKLFSNHWCTFHFIAQSWNNIVY